MDPSLVEKTLRKAQLAILNPTIADLSKFQDLSDKQLLEIQKGGAMPGSAGVKPLSFSTNIIVIDISGPNVTDLTFYDLPVSLKRTGRNVCLYILMKVLIRESLRIVEMGTMAMLP